MAESKSKPADLRKQYGAPFAIISHDEGARYTSLLSRGFNPPRCLDFQLLRTHRWSDEIDAHCRTLGFESIVKTKHSAYRQLTLQFYTTMKFRGDGGFSCRLMGKRVTVTRKTLCDVFGFPDGGHESVPKDFDPDGFWEEISGGGGDFHAKKPSSFLIKDPILRLMHRYISYVVFGRFDLTTVSAETLFYLWCLRRHVLVSTPCFLLATFKSVIHLTKRRKICLGDFVTAIAVHFGVFDPSATNMMVIPARAIALATIKDASNEKEESDDQDDEEEDDATAPVVDAWMLISHQAEKMMKDGFTNLEACFDGLEKKFNSMCARFQTFQQEWADSRHRKSNKTIEELSMEVKKIKESLAKLSGMKEKEEGNRSMPKADTDLFPGVQLPSKSVGSKASSKNGDRNTPQPCTGEFDIAHTVLQPGSDEFMEPLCSGMKSETRKCSAASDIIEILDSDDETNHTKAAKSSKRVLRSDEMNLVMTKKRIRTGSMWKKQVRRVNEDHEKGSVEEACGSQNDLNGRVSTDSENESLSDSKMDELVASIRR